MAIKILAVFVLLGVPAALANGHVGYDYRVPAALVQLPTNLKPNINQFQQPQYDNGHILQNGFVPSKIYQQHYNDGFYKNQYSQAQQQSSQYNYQGYQNGQTSYRNENYNQNLGSSNLLNMQNLGGDNLLSLQNAQQTFESNNQQSNPVQRPSSSNSKVQSPIITKHIYFHLPPEEETAKATPVTLTPPKKTYNIIFIKLPSQKSSNAARLQHIFNQQAAAESKTLIYVLVKKSQLQPLQPVTSKPEVFFVKYKEPKRVAQSVNSGSLQLAPVIQGSAPGLLAGQVNGHGYK